MTINIVSALDSGASGPGSSPGWRHCVVFLDKTLILSNAGGNTTMDQGGGEILYLAIFSEISTTCYE